MLVTLQRGVVQEEQSFLGVGFVTAVPAPLPLVSRPLGLLALPGQGGEEVPTRGGIWGSPDGITLNEAKDGRPALEPS